MLCNRCQEAPRIEGSHFCSSCSRLCSKCLNSPRRNSHRYCKECMSAAHDEWAATKLSDRVARIKNNARAYARVYLKRGIIQKSPCEVCRDPNSHMHHADYRKPAEVRWLCRTHHRELHETTPSQTDEEILTPLQRICKLCKVEPVTIPGALRCTVCRRLCGRCKEDLRGKSSRYCNSCQAQYMRDTRPAYKDLSEDQKERSRCRAYANTYLKRGLIEKKPCEVSGCRAPACMHHEDFSRPLKIRWICRSHLREMRQAL
jgi:hypothetical protein